MKGLIWKNLLALRKSLALAAAYLLLISCLAFQSNGADFAPMMVMVFVGAMGMGLFNADEAAHTQVYIRALPVSTRQIVTARYVTLLSIDAVGVLAGLTLTVLAGASVPEFLVGALVVIVLLMGVNVPLMYRFGSNKGRLALLAVAAGVIACGFMLAGFLHGPEPDLTAIDAFITAHVMPVFLGVIAACAALLVVSWLISCRIVARKEA